MGMNATREAELAEYVQRRDEEEALKAERRLAAQVQERQVEARQRHARWLERQYQELVLERQKEANRLLFEQRQKDPKYIAMRKARDERAKKAKMTTEVACKFSRRMMLWSLPAMVIGLAIAAYSSVGAFVFWAGFITLLVGALRS